MISTAVPSPRVTPGRYHAEGEEGEGGMPEQAAVSCQQVVRLQSGPSTCSGAMPAKVPLADSTR
jgi:hypothetical protein